MSRKHVVKVEWTLFQIISSTCETTTIPYCLSVMHMSLWLCVFVIIRRDQRVKIGQKSLPFALAFVFYPHPTIAHCLHFVSMAWKSRFLEVSKIVQKHRYIFLTIIIIIVTMIMNNIDLSLVLIYTIGAFLTLDASRIIWIQFFTFSLGNLTWSTQFYQVKHDSQGGDSKHNMVYICSRHAKTNPTVSVLRVLPQFS